MAQAAINGRYLYLYALKTGTTTLTIEDSAKNAKVDVLVTVRVMASTPSQVNMIVGDYEGVYMNGGNSPYTISQQPNSAIVLLNEFSSGGYEIRGLRVGTTSMIVTDNSNPKNSVTIPITIKPKPKFATAGSMSFQSNKENFETQGIYTEADDAEGFPTNDEGAEGFLTLFDEGGNICTIVGYKKHSETSIDVVVIFFAKTNLSPGSLTFDSTWIIEDSVASCFVTFNGNIATHEAESYILTSGTVVLTQYSKTHAAGTFVGNGVNVQNGNAIIGNEIALTNGKFTVPLLAEEEIFLSKRNVEKQQIANYARKITAHWYNSLTSTTPMKIKR